MEEPATTEVPDSPESLRAGRLLLHLTRLMASPSSQEEASESGAVGLWRLLGLSANAAVTLQELLLVLRRFLKTWEEPEKVGEEHGGRPCSGNPSGSYIVGCTNGGLNNRDWL